MSDNLLQVVKAELSASPSTWLLTLEDGGIRYHNTAISGELPFYVAPANPVVELEEYEDTDFQEAPSSELMDDEYPDDVGQDPGIEDPHRAEPWRLEDIPLGELCSDDRHMDDISNIVKAVVAETARAEKIVHAAVNEDQGKVVNALPSHPIGKSIFFESRIRFEDGENLMVKSYEPGKVVIQVGTYAEMLKTVTMLGSYVGTTPRVSLTDNIPCLRMGSDRSWSGKNLITYTGNFQVTTVSIKQHGETQYLLTVE